MKVYVDEMPKCCSDCPCFYDESISCQASDKWLDLSIEKNFNRGKQIHKKCPLQSLTELKKQIRKEVVQEIKDKTFGLWYFVLDEQKEHFENNRYVLSKKDFDEILDRIEGKGNE